MCLFIFFLSMKYLCIKYINLYIKIYIHAYTRTCICIRYMFIDIHMYLNKPIFQINYTFSEIMFENKTKVNLINTT